MPEPAREVHDRVMMHLLGRIGAAEAWGEPFAHAYLTDLFPADIYAALLESLPPAGRFAQAPAGPRGAGAGRGVFNLTVERVRRFPVGCRALWAGVTAALTSPKLKRGLFAKLAPDLVERHGVTAEKVPEVPGFSRPTLYRDSAGFALPPHPDALTKVVTMHLYLPADPSQIHLGTAIYRRGERGDFTPCRQFEFRPNSGYAFAVSDGPTRRSWHGREPIPDGAGVRNSLLNTFYAEPRPEYASYLDREPG